MNETEKMSAMSAGHVPARSCEHPDRNGWSEPGHTGLYGTHWECVDCGDIVPKTTEELEWYSSLENPARAWGETLAEYETRLVNSQVQKRVS